MQRIERYGVIALVFLLVTIVAVSLWGEQKKSEGFFSFLKPDSKSAQVEQLLADASQERASADSSARRGDPLDRGLALSGRQSAADSGRAFSGPGAAPAGVDALVDERQASILPPRTPTGLVVDPKPRTREEVVSVPPASAAGTREYTIRSGDTLSEISQRELGTQKRWRELLDANPGLDPARLSVGNVIQIPGGQARSTPAPQVAARAQREAPAPVTPAPAASGGRTYTIRPGDTLSQIAQNELGTQARWRELVQLNSGLDPARLAVGQKIQLPAGAAPAGERVARAETKPTSVARSGSRVR